MSENDKRISFHLTLDKDEDKMLTAKAECCNISRTEYIRNLIRGCCPTEAPPKEFYHIFEKVNRLSARMNEIANEAMLRGYYKEADLNEIRLTAYKIKVIISDMRKIVLSARPIDEEYFSRDS